MNHRIPSFCVFAITSALLLPPVTGKAEEKQEQTETAAKVTLDGHFESKKTVEVKFDPKHISAAKIRKIAARGGTVEKGDFLISLEREAYADQVKEAARKMANTELSRQEAEFAHKQFVETQKLSRQAAERAWAAAQDDYHGYREFDRQYAIDSAEFSLQQSRNSLEYLEEDLRQLERMYQEDELTEESEELVLIRARRAIESAKFRLRNTEVQTERTLTKSLPRESQSQEEKYNRAKLAYEKAIADLNFAEKKDKLSRAAADDAFEKEKKELEELRADGEKLVLDAPATGLLFYGKLNRGQVADKPEILEPGTSVSKDQVLFTIVNPKQLQIRCSVAEKDIGNLRVGMRGKATPTSAPDQQLDVTIESLESIPYAKGKFDCIIRIRKGVSDILPTMTCSLEFDVTAQAEQEKASAKEAPSKKAKAKKAKANKTERKKVEAKETPSKEAPAKKAKEAEGKEKSAAGEE